MHALRFVFVLACLGCAAILVSNAPWEGRLTRGNHTWIVDLGRAPIWAPPPEPPYATFRQDFKESEGFPPEGPPSLAIRRVLRLDWMSADLLLYLWSVSVLAGLLYLAMRGHRRDLILYLALSVGVGLTAAAAACIGLWLFYGGWGPPFPEFFGALGLVAGIVAGLASFKQGQFPVVQSKS
jgi:hypothetical protein